MSEKNNPLPKPSTPLKSISEKTALSFLKEMLSGKNVPKRPEVKAQSSMSNHLKMRKLWNDGFIP